MCIKLVRDSKKPRYNDNKKQPFTKEIETDVKISITNIGINGEGIAYANKKTIFCPRTLPKEEVVVSIVKEEQKYKNAILKEVITPSPERVLPLCKHYDICAGCSLMHAKYDYTLKIKNEILRESLFKYVKNFNSSVIAPVVPSPLVYHYRNKANVPVRFINGKSRFGLFNVGTNHFKTLDYCLVQDDVINTLLSDILLKMDELKIPAVDIKGKNGFVANIIIRVAYYSRDTQVSFILAVPKDITPLVDYLSKKYPYIRSISSVVNPKFDTPHVFNDTIKLLYGDKTITEKLGDYSYRLTPESFFQLNTPQASKMYELVVSSYPFNGTEVVIDAYAGVAPISFYLSKHVKQVYAIELENSSINSAKKTILTNNIKNIRLINKEFLAGFKEIFNMDFDVIVFDPPRTGLTESVVELVLKKKIPAIIYISCSPSTLAKDIQLLQASYKIVKITPLDMFPYTSHIESITVLKLKDNI
ncbi:MAG: 23S rRNA (uracil(1939)-C(5))-methyltransferase RlmD [Acholeplasmatales bacterium]|jgi:23S rRNA (uracil1939-C5)-methyltransferase|nr:23S rRNA (uracil(1939)-C(5))-methyltransferase RlmD [Acholeplasmatales bacterium]